MNTIDILRRLRATDEADIAARKEHYAAIADLIRIAVPKVPL